LIDYRKEKLIRLKLYGKKKEITIDNFIF